MKNIVKKIAAYIVCKELRKIRLFTGSYDATNGNQVYMYGILSVIEFISYMVSEEYCDKLVEEFSTNMMISEEQADE